MTFIVVTGTGAGFNMMAAFRLHQEVLGSSLQQASEDLSPIYNNLPDGQLSCPVGFAVADAGQAARFVDLARQVGVQCHLRSSL